MRWSGSEEKILLHDLQKYRWVFFLVLLRTPERITLRVLLQFGHFGLSGDCGCRAKVDCVFISGAISGII